MGARLGVVAGAGDGGQRGRQRALKERWGGGGWHLIELGKLSLELQLIDRRLPVTVFLAVVIADARPAVLHAFNHCAPPFLVVPDPFTDCELG